MSSQQPGVPQTRRPSVAPRPAVPPLTTALMATLLALLIASLLAACGAPTIGAAPHAASHATSSATSSAMAGVSGTSTTKPSTVYFSAYPNQISALDAATGALRWRAHISEQPLRPLFAQGAVYFASQALTGPTTGASYVSALRASDGALLWRHKLGDFVLSPPSDAALAWANGVVYLSAQANIYAIRASDGAQLWKAKLPTDTAPPAVSDGMVYTLTWSDGPGEQLFVLNASTGAIRWHSAILTGGANEPNAPLVAGGMIYADTGDALYALLVSGGALRWQAKLPGFSFTPTLVNGVVYDGNGGMNAFQATTGQLLWSVTVSTPPFEDITQADAAGAYVASYKSFIAYDPTNGKQRWSVTPLGNSGGAFLTLAGGAISAVAGNAVAALNTTNGATRWRTTLPAGAQAGWPPTIG
ncbi:MAG TPA: PQQ-binding-like beta-propeller repeat protein [Ktedonobacterales bacterium]|nr:PQQ-binding-like beta-propeller repeat protein [Ktedonobacterales bacterium]